jgi:hypothetical protein
MRCEYWRWLELVLGRVGISDVGPWGLATRESVSSCPQVVESILMTKSEGGITNGFLSITTGGLLNNILLSAGVGEV